MQNVIKQGDRYAIPFQIKNTKTGEYITPDDCAGVVIKLDDVEKSTNLVFDDDLHAWLFYITQEMSLSYCDMIYAQCQVYLAGGDVISSKKIEIKIEDNIIKTIRGI